MTGIAGIVDFSGAPVERLVASMVAALGPGAATFTAAGRIRVAFEGAIYNAGDLGVGTDQEIVAYLYDRYGFTETLRRLNGDFALALYDPDREQLWLGRDRFGIRPLYVHQRRDRIAFATRPRALLLLPDVSPTPDRRFVACFAGSHYRTFDNQPDRSPYAEIGQIPASGYLLAGRGGMNTGTWWGLEDQPLLEGAETDLAERYRELLLDAVRIRHRRARRPAFTLSGGMDSSSVLACAVTASGSKQVAYSTVYSDPTFDETAEIGSSLERCVSSWRPVRVSEPDLEAIVPRMIAANDEPVATATWLSHFLLCEQAARDGVGVLFGGLGGDELNAGEYEYFPFFFADLQVGGETGRLELETARWIQHHDHPIYRKSTAVRDEALGRLVDLSRPGRCLADMRRLARYRDTVRPAYYDLAGFSPAMAHPFSRYLDNRAYQDIFRETAPCCLRAADRHTRLFGMEACWPFFDHRVVELLFRVPPIMKIRDGVTKFLLREAMRGLLPEETRTRVKKTGWNAPAHLWFSGRGREMLLDLVGSRAFAERGIYDLPRVRHLIDEHQAIVASGALAENHMMFLWQLFNLELWLRGLDALAFSPGG